MKATRRRFIQTSALAGAGLALSGRKVLGAGLDPIKNLRKFVAPLPGLGPTGIPVASANTSLYPGTDFYLIVAGQHRQQMHPDLPSTKLWGYADATSLNPKFRYLGPAIVATKGKPVRMKFVNLLPSVHPLPVDTTLPGAEPGQAVNRAAIHLHGGFVPWPSDGGPFHWIAPNFTHGPSHIWWLPDRLGLPTDDLWIPNAQTSRLMWYHDHAMGITRLNAYAGLAAPYVLVDDDEVRLFGASGVIAANQLPGIPLVLQDKSFKSRADQWGRRGDLDYPSSYGPPDGPVGTPPPISCVPEFFADTAVINGMAFPELTIPAGVHRFRLLNGTQSRVWNLQLYYERESSGDPTNRKGPDFIQIGTEGGFLPRPVIVSSGNPIDVDKYLAHDQTGYSLVLGGAERADVLIDFSECAGASFILYNDAPAPFPMGDPASPFDNDYFTGHGAPDSAHGPNTRTLMRIRITPAVYSGPTLSTGLLDLLATELGLVDLGLLIQDSVIGSVFEIPPNANQRIKTLNEGFDEFGRLQQFVGTTDSSMGAGGTKYGTEYMDPLTPDDQPARGSIEVWDIYNTTGDVHPIHIHLVNAQVMGRAPFAQDEEGNPVGGVFTPSGPFIPPDPNERGYKETIRMNPGEVTRLIMKFDLPPDPVVNVRGHNRTVHVPMSPRTGGHEYVWHCHILEHEEHDMMRPLVVV